MEVIVKDVCLMKFGEPTAQGHIFTKAPFKQFIKDRKKSTTPLFGCVEDRTDMSGYTNMANITHEVKNLRIVGNSLLGDIKILNTPLGRALGDALKGTDIPIAMRAFGAFNEEGKATQLNILTFDISKYTVFPDAVIKSESYLKEIENESKK